MKSLWKSELTFRTLLDSVSEGLLQVDHDDVIQFVNKRFCEMFGYSEEEVLGKNGYELIIRNEDYELVREKNNLRRQGISDKYEILAKKKSGEMIWVEIAGSPFRDDSGEITGSIAVLTDIGDRRLAQDELRKSEQRFRGYFELGLVGMAITSLEKGWVEVNDKMCEILGYERSQLFETTWVDLTHPDDLAADLALFDSVLVGQREGYSLDKRFIRADGNVVCATISVQCLRRPDGTPEYFLALMQDISERKRQEQAIQMNRQELQFLTEKLIRAQEAERRFVARELHDEVGQSLALLKIILEGAENQDEHAVKQNALIESGQIVDRLLRQVRALSLDLRPSLLDDLGLAPALRWYLDRQAQQTGLKIDFESDTGNVEISKEMEITCFRVIQEALTNVFRHSHATKFQLQLRSSGESLHLQMSDNGDGFDVAIANQRAQYGEGLGVLGMQERVRLVGGHIRIDSSLGRGTQIRISFPLA